MKRRIAVFLTASLLAMAVSAVPVSGAEGAAATREYFENLDKESRLEDIVADIGNYSIEGSGILYHVWHLKDGSRAKAVFDSRGRIAMIYITGENAAERIYKREYRETGPDGDSPEDPGNIDILDAVREMEQAIGLRIPASGRMSYPSPLQPEFELFDITGDGCADLFTCVTWGSGMVRTDLVVYDPAEKALYVLDGYNYDYTIDHTEEDRIVIAMEGPHGYNEPILKIFGTVRLEDGKIVFVPDPEDR